MGGGFGLRRRFSEGGGKASWFGLVARLCVSANEAAGEETKSKKFFSLFSFPPAHFALSFGSLLPPLPQRPSFLRQKKLFPFLFFHLPVARSKKSKRSLRPDCIFRGSSCSFFSFFLFPSSFPLTQDPEPDCPGLPRGRQV